MFNSLRDKLSGIKENFVSKIKEKSEQPIEYLEKAAAKEVPVAVRATPNRAARSDSALELDVSGKISVAARARSLLFEQEVILDESDLRDPLWELEVALLESDVALPVAEEIVSSVRDQLLGKKKKIRADTGEIVEDALRSALLEVLSTNSFDFDEFLKNAEKPVNIVFVGVNGTGKTTTIAKVANYLKERGYSPVLAAGDTFRTGAVEQLETHANRLGLKMIKHKAGGDPAAVIFDAVEHAKAHHKDVVLADTAGRLHTNINLMDQMKKIVRVTEPDLLIFVDEAIAGNDAVERAREFNDAVAIDGTILTKTDADARGGAAISIAHITGKPVIFLGVGQEYPDLVKFDPLWLVDRLLGAD